MLNVCNQAQCCLFSFVIYLSDNIDISVKDSDNSGFAEGFSAEIYLYYLTHENLVISLMLSKHDDIPIDCYFTTDFL